MYGRRHSMLDNQYGDVGCNEDANYNCPDVVCVLGAPVFPVPPFTLGRSAKPKIALAR